MRDDLLAPTRALLGFLELEDVVEVARAIHAKLHAPRPPAERRLRELGSWCACSMTSRNIPTDRPTWSAPCTTKGAAKRHPIRHRRRVSSSGRAAGRRPAAPPGASYLISGRSARQTRGLGHHDAPNFAEEDAVASVVMHFDAFGRKPSSYEYHFWSSIAARGSVRRQPRQTRKSGASETPTTARSPQARQSSRSLSSNHSRRSRFGSAATGRTLTPSAASSYRPSVRPAFDFRSPWDICDRWGLRRQPNT
jgi:hypothetical protein